MLNAVVISVLVMVILSLLRVNVLFALIIAALTAGLMSGMNMTDSVGIMIAGMGGQSQTALSYILLGIFAVMIGMSGITSVLVNVMLKIFSGKKLILVFTLAGIACLSQNAIPVHIAFIPILIPPLLILFDRLKLDRRAVASALTFGLKFPYITLPVGFGFIFQNIIREEMTKNGIEITLNEITKAMLFPGAAMVIGLFIALLITYRKDRVAKKVEEVKVQDIDIADSITEQKDVRWKVSHGFTVIAIIVALVLQIVTESLVIGALSGIIIMFIFRVVKMYEGDKVVNEGIGMMGMIAFVMLVASGYANVLKETGAVDELVEKTLAFTGDSHFVIAFFLLTVGLLITMGIGTSFGTIPILAALYVPVMIAVGMSPLACAALIGTAAALGDAGSPASDSTLGPTSGLNADGKHHHIWDTCVPTFLHYNIPLFIFGLIAAMVL
ncbi:Na+/H+ antiporter family protein [Pseudogracilibacillus auburnensis]|uniref:Na+/H+ antiporter family protein n=1 Tax=Pseudogracilibacillus auburnensis TaxID=1494959 RepID=UPI001A968DF7|nr:Na+/H+ antiporter NhaC family protein [Pseudogracilibacillus auburnensis]MBO1002851.1 TRAP transporter large permease subunit [Pseudogracilibacillus auburnensis]